MPLTREFKETVMELAQDREFRVELLREALDSCIQGDVATGLALLKDYLNATSSFDEVAMTLNFKVQSMRRMFSAKGNPNTINFFNIFHCLIAREGIHDLSELSTT